MRHLFRIIACMAAAAAFCLVMNIQAEARDSSGDIVIIVDPGHGGNDGGAVSAYDTEAELNWNIAVALKAELQTYNGVKVYLTRGSAEWNSNAARGRMGAQLGADLFVSVHNNSGTGSSANGVQVYGTVNAAYKASIQTLCNNIASHVSALGLTNGGYHTRVSTNDSSRDYYTMLDEAVKCGIPGLIIEHCYLSNPSDAEFIHNEENQKKCGIADATAIAEYYGLTKRGVYAGSEITLLRTYSAHMLGNLSGTYTSSDNSVAYVNESGLITAVCTICSTVYITHKINAVKPHLISTINAAATAAALNIIHKIIFFLTSGFLHKLILISCLISNSPYRFDNFRILRVVFNLIPQTLYVHRQRIIIDEFSGHVPYLLQQLVSGQHRSYIVKKYKQELIFQCG